MTAHNKRIFFMAEMANNALRFNTDLQNNIIDAERTLKESQAWILNENELANYEAEIIKALPVVKKLLYDELARLKK